MLKIGLYSESDIERVQKHIRVTRTNTLQELLECKVIIVDGLAKFKSLLDNDVKIPLVVLLESPSELNSVKALKHNSLIFFRFKTDPIDTIKETIFLIDKLIKE
jgi:hypothetical protein